MAVLSAVRSRWRRTSPAQLVGVGLDSTGRFLQFIAILDDSDVLLVFHAMPATKKVIDELGLGRRRR